MTEDQRTLETVTQIFSYKLQSSINQSVSPHIPISTLSFIVASTPTSSPFFFPITSPSLYFSSHLTSIPSNPRFPPQGLPQDLFQDFLQDTPPSPISDCSSFFPQNLTRSPNKILLPIYLTNIPHGNHTDSTPIYLSQKKVWASTPQSQASNLRTPR